VQRPALASWKWALSALPQAQRRENAPLGVFWPQVFFQIFAQNTCLVPPFMPNDQRLNPRLKHINEALFPALE